MYRMLIVFGDIPHFLVADCFKKTQNIIEYRFDQYLSMVAHSEHISHERH